MAAGTQGGGSGQTGSGTQARSGGQQGQGMQGRNGGLWGGGGRLRMGLVWVKQGELIIPHRVKTGISDNSSTEIEGSIKEGDELITGIVNINPGQQTTQQQNPFAPQMGRPQQGGAGARGGR